MLQALQVGNLDILWDTWKVTQRSWGIWIVYDIYIYIVYIYNINIFFCNVCIYIHNQLHLFVYVDTV